jgi:hypothetical protein
MLPAQASRKIFYRRRAVSPDNGSGRTFTWDQFDTTEQGYFSDSQSLLNYVRGTAARRCSMEASCETAGTYPVGDIVNSSRST